MNNSNFKVNGVDIGTNLVPKSYLLDRYPELLDNFRFAGLWGFGDNQSGQLGDNTSIKRSSPVQTIAGGANWKQIACGYQHNAAIKTDGTLWLWGINSNGQLGDNTTSVKYSPVQTLTGGTNWKQAACGQGHTLVIKTDGTLWAWGSNSGGQLGDNTVANKSSPVQISAGGANWKQVASGNASYYSAAIKTDGTLWTWGQNLNGQLGDNTVAEKSSPVQTIAAGTNWRQVSCGSSFVAAIKTDGTLWLWGWNQYGQLGDNTIVNKSSPVQTIAGGANWKQVAAGYATTAAIKTDGTLWLWGLGLEGALGNNLAANVSSPVQTVSGGTNWKQVAAGSSIAAIKTDGTLWTWGYNGIGELGDNTVANKSSPVQTVASGSNWRQVECGYNHKIAIRDDSSDIL